MGWITAQVDEAIAAGVTEEITGAELSSFKFEDQLDVRRRTRETTALRTRRYSPPEELDLLIDSTIKALEDARRISTALSEYVRSIHASDPEFAPLIEFIPDDEGAGRPVLTFAADEATTGQNDLSAVLNSLRALR
jgi:hypothetical protein